MLSSGTDTSETEEEASEITDSTAEQDVSGKEESCVFSEKRECSMLGREKELSAEKGPCRNPRSSRQSRQRRRVIGKKERFFLCMMFTSCIGCIIREKAKFVNGIAFFTRILYNQFVTEIVFYREENRE